MSANAVCNPYGVARLLLGQFQAELGDTRGGVPAVMAVFQGQSVVAEGCDSAWVALGPMVPSDGHGKPPVVRRNAVVVWTITLQMGVFRCYPVQDRNAMPPLPSIDPAARDIADDAEAMRRAALGAWDGHPQVQALLGRWTPMPPQGGVHGSTMDVQVQLSMGAMADDVFPKLAGDPRS